MTTFTVVDGIPTVLAPGSDARVRAGLVFRVGYADETLTTCGITHLVEHLALHEVAGHDVHLNGDTGQTHTRFHVEGTTAEVVAFLNGVCAALGSLPMNRLQTEQRVLRSEAQRRSPVADLPWIHRYGAQGFGLIGQGDLAVPALTSDAVLAWSRQRFTRANVVLWIEADEVPAGLDLTLPAGVPFPAPEPVDVAPTGPLWAPGMSEDVVMSALLPRGAATSVLAALLDRLLFRELRHRFGYSYSAGATLAPASATSSMLHLHADGLPEVQGAVMGVVVDVLARLTLGSIADDDVDAARALIVEQYDQPGLEALLLPQRAVEILSETAPVSVAELRRAAVDVTPEDVRAVARTFRERVLAQVPVVGLDWAGFALHRPGHSPDPAPGQGIRARAHRGEPSTLVVGDVGVTRSWPGTSVTVRYAETAALIDDADGSMTLIGRDGTRVLLDPSCEEVTEQMRAVVRSHVAPERVIGAVHTDTERPASDVQPPGRPGRPKWFSRAAR